MVLSALFDGAGPLFLFALPFFVLYFWSKKNWWALMIAGGLTSVGLVTVLSILIPNGQNAMTGVYNSVLLLGFAFTMGALWLRRATIPPAGPSIRPRAFWLGCRRLHPGQGVGDLSQEFKAILFMVGSAAFFLAYFLHGVRKWGWLFPAFACAARTDDLMDTRGWIVHHGCASSPAWPCRSSLASP
jgi:hypothetical protein